MGNNTVALFLNDMADDLRRRPEAVAETLYRAMCSGQGGSLCQIVEALPSVHADATQIILAGGNRITSLGIMFDHDHSEETLIREMARRLGYSLRKKVKRP